MIDSAIHPILNSFYSEFISEHEKASGILIKDTMDESKIEKNFNLIGSYFVCNSSINLDLKESVLFTGPLCQNEHTYGGSLLAGRAVSIKVPKMGCYGHVDNPVVIVGLESVSIDITACGRIENFVIYLMKDAKFSFTASGFSAFKNMQVIRLNQNGDDLEMKVEFDWPSHEDYLKSCILIASSQEHNCK